MKKLTFIKTVLLASFLTAFLFMGCQKEQNAVTTDSTTGSESTHLKGVAGSGAFEGSIDGSYAAALQQNFSNTYSDKNQSLRVAFSAKDLVAFITNLQKKNKTDIIYVNFGVYGNGATAPDPKDNGRMTVFFTGNNMSRPTGSVKTDGVDISDDFLNHGNIYP